MLTIKRRKAQLSVAAVAALAIFAVAAVMLLTGSFTTGPAQAQSGGGTDGSTSPWPDPQPCGPGAGVAFQPEPHEVTTGHFALFDAYWQATGSDPNEGIMHTNECPPKMVKETRYNPTKEKNEVIISRAVSNIDLGEAIIHVNNDYQVDVVATNAEATNGQLSLQEYPGVRNALGLIAPDGTDMPVPAGTQVWWLKLDDPDTTTGENKDETSKLSIGFSTALFDEKYWLKSDDEGGQPMRYMLETTRFRNVNPAEAPHFFAYEAPKLGNGAQENPVLDSTAADIAEHDMTLEPGEYRALQWIFTKEGTYDLSAHLQGFVRDERRRLPDAADDWKPISSKEDETSEVRDYIFQVGNKLDETEPPRFGVSVEVHEEATAGTHVGQPVQVLGAEVPDLIYSLAGDNHSDFSVVSGALPTSAQIVVASGADLDYSTTDSYELLLQVSDGKDHEGNMDPSVHHFIAVNVAVIEAARVYLSSSKRAPKVGESITLSVGVWNLPDEVTPQELSYLIRETKSTGEVVSASALFPTAPSYIGTRTLSKDSAGTYTYTPSASYTHNGVYREIQGDPVTVTWRNKGQ